MAGGGLAGRWGGHEIKNIRLFFLSFFPKQRETDLYLN